MSSPVVIKIVGDSLGRPTSHDGKYVLEFRAGTMDRHGVLHGGILRSSPERFEALKFPSALEALEFWRQANGLRPDGKPNRPLTAFTIEIQSLDPAAFKLACEGAHV